jgi:hypothetical protein
MTFISLMSRSSYTDSLQTTELPFPEAPTYQEPVDVLDKAEPCLWVLWLMPSVFFSEDYVCGQQVQGHTDRVSVTYIS